MDKEITTSAIKGANEGVDSGGEIERVTGYTISDSSDTTKEIDPSNKNCYAKKTILKTGDNKTRNKYFVKVGVDGYIFNPWGMYSEGTQGRYEKGYGKSKWSFSEVSEQCFNFYIKFLQSRSKSWLTHANREIL